MLYAYLLLAPLSVGGVALFLKGRKPWLKVAGFILFGVTLFGLLFIPIIVRQPPNF